VRDYVSKNLFEELIADEEGHIDFLETQLELHESLGLQGFALLQAKSADDAE
jgi:bacterioferritin